MGYTPLRFFEYDEFHNAIKARLDFYTDTDKNISEYVP